MLWLRTAWHAEARRNWERNLTRTMGADMRYCSCCVTVVWNSVSFHLACDFLASAASRLKVNAAACVQRESSCTAPTISPRLVPIVPFYIWGSYAMHRKCGAETLMSLFASCGFVFERLWAGWAALPAVGCCSCRSPELWANILTL